MIPDEIRHDGVWAALEWLDERLQAIEDKLAIAATTPPAMPPEINPARHAVEVGGRWRVLPPKPWVMFDLLYRRRGRIVHKEVVAAYLWPGDGDYEPTDTNHLMRTYAYQLRKKLDGSRWQVRTHATLGWELIEAS